MRPLLQAGLSPARLHETPHAGHGAPGRPGGRRPVSEPARKPLLAVMLPTYNEKENIADMVEAILALPLDADVRVVVADDDSPDGTGRWAEERAAADPRVHALVRKKRRGRGAGGIDG
ncbi:MAG: glycosyltransferase, partial [Acidobacteria bacterium]|nr:glycosyltransferase [Acidobacteriota bacterium]